MEYFDDRFFRHVKYIIILSVCIGLIAGIIVLKKSEYFLFPIFTIVATAVLTLIFLFIIYNIIYTIYFQIMKKREK